MPRVTGLTGLAEAARRRNASVSESPYLQVGTIFLALVLLWIALSFASERFFTTPNILNIFLQSAVVGVVAAAFTVVLIGGEIDLSLASVQALVGTVAAILVIQEGVPVPAAMLAVLGVGIAAGLINGYFTVFAKMPSFIATLAMLGIAQGIAFVLSPRTIGGFPESYQVIGRGHLGPVPTPVVVLGGVYLLLHLLLTQTRYGVELYAVGGSRTAANRVGLRTGRVVMVTFALSGGLAAIAGIMLSSRLNSGHGGAGATDLLLDAIAAVVIGGTSLLGGAGTVIGTLVGVVMISTIRNGLVLLGVDPFWQQVAVGMIILVAVVVDQLFKGHIRVRDLVPLPRSAKRDLRAHVRALTDE